MIPDFKGRESFAGESWHTAEWPRDMSLDKLKGKKISPPTDNFKNVFLNPLTN